MFSMFFFLCVLLGSIQQFQTRLKDKLEVFTGLVSVIRVFVAFLISMRSSAKLYHL